jgi:D-alanyl-D-alanine carboxypeptidase/D-alanyl-D-alanine-endopeptidase (penicillin-binding protein 4)
LKRRTLKRRTWLGFAAAFLISLLLTGGFVDIGKPNAAIAQITSRPPTSRPPIDITRLRPAAPANLMAGSLCANNLATAIEQIIKRPLFATARWGIEVESVSPPATLYSRDAGNFLVPASNVKLLTTSAALQMLYYSPQQQPAVAARFGIINRDSDNDYAEALLNEIGGTESVKSALTSLGIDSRTYRQIDGSGLSRSNLAEPSMIVKLLKVMQSARGSDLFYNSLAVAGVNGTLARRFVNTPVQGKVHGKTGTLNGVRALSGYLDHPDYDKILFSIMVNQSDQGDDGESLKAAIDQVVLQLGRLKNC